MLTIEQMKTSLLLLIASLTLPIPAIAEESTQLPLKPGTNYSVEGSPDEVAGFDPYLDKEVPPGVILYAGMPWENNAVDARNLWGMLVGFGLGRGTVLPIQTTGALRRRDRRACRS